MKPALLAAAVLLGVHAPAFGLTVEQMIRLCRSPVPADRAACDFYAVGALDMISLAQELYGGAFPEICYPEDGLAARDAREIFLNWAANNETEGGAPMHMGFLQALRETLRCRK